MPSAADDLREFQRRLTRVRELMAAEGFDALLVVDDDDMDRPPRGDTRYLTDFSAGPREMAVIDARGIRRDGVERVRAIKSPWEITYIKQAQSYADAGVRALMQAARAGVPQVEAVAEAKYQAIRLGANEASVFMSAGRIPGYGGPTEAS